MSLLEQENVCIHGVVSLEKLPTFDRRVESLNVVRHNFEGGSGVPRVSHESEEVRLFVTCGSYLFCLRDSLRYAPRESEP